MITEPNKLEEVFSAALQRKAGPERSAFLDGICGDDSVLRERVEALLSANDSVGDFLQEPVQTGSVTVDGSNIIEGPGSIIGPYKLLERIGEGGMAVVYMAHQEKPLRRRVALKIIKLGMDTQQVIARFEVERQALALMDHPNIAKVLDAGATQTGRSYFVMELVRGVSITEYCDKHRLNMRERLELFVPVCNAVHHAHQKGIIHRDLKPSNILVTMHDGKPVPKVIDFGIAKATNHRLTV
jgi:serine/threonine protein kinase